MDLDIETKIKIQNYIRDEILLKSIEKVSQIEEAYLANESSTQPDDQNSNDRSEIDNQPMEDNIYVDPQLTKSGQDLEKNHKTVSFSADFVAKQPTNDYAMFFKNIIFLLIVLIFYHLISYLY